jgi:penicillin-binding protein 1A
MVAMDPHTGRVLAMVGGFSFSQSEFNRATQAYAPAGFVLQAVRLRGGARQWLHAGVGGARRADQRSGSGNQDWSRRTMAASSAGPSTLRAGIERSRNLMTVRLANDMGMKIVAEYAERFGVYDNLACRYLPMSLGSGETTVMRMVTAYSVMANGGKQIKPSLIDRIQDRYGKTVFKSRRTRLR